MATKKRGAGAMTYLVHFDKRAEVDDGYGNTESGWVEQFRANAELTFLRGTETVMAGRLAGRQTAVMRVRSHEKSRLVTPEYRAVDARTGTEYAIRGATPTDDRLYIELLVESGVPSV